VLIDGVRRLAVETSVSVNAPPSADGIAQYVVAGKVFSAVASVNMASSGADNPLVLLRNPIGSGKKLYLFDITAGTTTKNEYAVYRVYAMPTITTVGTTLTPINNYINAITPAPVGEVFGLPTLASLGMQIRNFNNGQNANGVEVIDSNSAVIEEGGSIVITGAPSSNNRNAEITLIWIEI
jgi:hypothetical protein